jgi:DNA-binding GntR family transcriptional regulator
VGAGHQGREVVRFKERRRRGRTPAEEALPQRGFCVTPLSVADRLDLTRARVLIETAVVRESIGQGGLEWESAVIAAHHTLQGTPYTTREGHLGGPWSEAHHAFHRALLTGAKSPRLESIATELRDCSLLYQCWSIDIARDLDRDVAAEHRNLAELAVARDAEGAVKALTEHIERTTAALLAYAESKTEPARRVGISA